MDIIEQQGAPEYEPEIDMQEPEDQELATGGAVRMRLEESDAEEDEDEDEGPVAAPAPAVQQVVVASAGNKKRRGPVDDGIRRGLETINGIWDIMVDGFNDKMAIDDFPWKVNELLFSVAGLRAEPQRDPIWARVDSMQIALQRIQEAKDDIDAIKSIIGQVEEHIMNPPKPSPFQAKKAKKA